MKIKLLIKTKSEKSQTQRKTFLKFPLALIYSNTKLISIHPEKYFHKALIYAPHIDVLRLSMARSSSKDASLQSAGLIVKSFLP